MREVSPEVQEIWSLIKENQKGLKALQESIREDRKRAIEDRKRAIEDGKIMRERSAKIDQQMAETDRLLKERFAETDRQLKASSAEHDRQFEKLRKSQKETSEGLKRARALFESQWGRLMESLVEGDLLKILNKRGVAVKNTYKNLKSGYGKDQYEYDIVAGNGDEVVVVEVKSCLKVEHVKIFLEDLRKFSSRIVMYENKTIYGAVAFLRVEQEAERYAAKQGLFAIRATGDSASIINTEDFKPKVFQ